MRLLAAAVFAGLALVAGAVVYYTLETRDPDRYADAEQMASAAFNAAGEKPVSVRRVSGPFVVVKLNAEQCVLVDVSTQYSGPNDGDADFFWAVFPGADGKSVDC